METTHYKVKLILSGDVEGETPNERERKLTKILENLIGGRTNLEWHSIQVEEQ